MGIRMRACAPEKEYVSMHTCLFVCVCARLYVYFLHVSVYVFMCRHVYVYEYDCFMYVHMCTYCIYMYIVTMYSTVRILLVSI